MGKQQEIESKQQSMDALRIQLATMHTSIATARREAAADAAKQLADIRQAIATIKLEVSILKTEVETQSPTPSPFATPVGLIDTAWNTFIANNPDLHFHDQVPTLRWFLRRHSKQLALMGIIKRVNNKWRIRDQTEFNSATLALLAPLIAPQRIKTIFD